MASIFPELLSFRERFVGHKSIVLKHGLIDEVIPWLLILSIDLIKLTLALHLQPDIADTVLNFWLVEYIVKYYQTILLVKQSNFLRVEAVNIEGFDKSLLIGGDLRRPVGLCFCFLHNKYNYNEHQICSVKYQDYRVQWRLFRARGPLVFDVVSWLRGTFIILFERLGRFLSNSDK